MLFSIVVLLMVILITSFWAYQGLFSAVIMFFESVIAVMLAFAFFEQVHGLWAASLDAGTGLPLAFMLIFIISMVVMRVATDKLIPGTIMFNLYIERAGGAVFGFFTGLILVGSALVAIQMLPLGSGVLGFQRLSANKDGFPVRKSFLFKPDGFVVGMAEMLSNGRFGGDNPIALAKPDYLLELYSARACPQHEARMVVPSDCLKVKRYWRSNEIDHVTQSGAGNQLNREFTTHEPADSRNTFLVFRVQLAQTAGPKIAANEIRFRTPQFRLVGPEPNKNLPGVKPHVYLACGLSDIYTHKTLAWDQVRQGQSAKLVRFNATTNLILNPTLAEPVIPPDPSNCYQLDVAFEVPDDLDFHPWYIEFKRGARIDLRTMKPDDAPPPGFLEALQRHGGTSATNAGEVVAGKKVGAPRPGRTHVANAIEERTDATTLLPVALDKSSNLVARRLQRGKFHEGHIWVVVPEEEIDDADAVTELLAPRGKRIVQVGAEQMHAQGMYGRALNYAAAVAAQIKVTTSGGQTYFAQGVYSSAMVGNERIFEIQYWPTAEIPERCLKKPKKLTKNIMKNANPAERKFGYIFVVDPGVTITAFSAGRRDGVPQRLKIKVPG